MLFHFDQLTGAQRDSTEDAEVIALVTGWRLLAGKSSAI